MRIAVAHANPDFDAYAALVAATCLFPDTRAVFLGSQNPNVRAFHNLHGHRLRFTDLASERGKTIEELILVDTSDPARTGEASSLFRDPRTRVRVYDHHAGDALLGFSHEDHRRQTGATTTILAQQIESQGIVPTPLEATVMLLGIHEDTGSLTFAGTTEQDVRAVAFLMGCGADITALSEYLGKGLTAEQLDVQRQLDESLAVVEMRGHRIALATATSEHHVDAAGTVSHHLVGELGYPAAIALIATPDRVSVVARARGASIDVGKVMAVLGGGGHGAAASAALRGISLEDALTRVREALEVALPRDPTVQDVMSRPVTTVAVSQSMQEAGALMARWSYSRLPVVDEQGRVVGLVGRTETDKATMHGLDHAPVAGFLSRTFESVSPRVSIAAVEDLIAEKGVGTVLVTQDGMLQGIVTRDDVLRARHHARWVDRGAAHRAALEQRVAHRLRNLEDSRLAEAIETIGRRSVTLGINAWAVGGFVRDCLLGIEDFDLDIVVEGDASTLAVAVAAALGVTHRTHDRFGTATIVLASGAHLDLVSSRAEYYTRPAALPTVEHSTLHQDLRRRDFAMNALACSLMPDRLGALVDPFGGLEDIEARRVRVLHSLSFVDDPTRILRAARFEARLRFEMDDETEGYARGAVDGGFLAEVSGARLREELLPILADPAAASALARLHELGALQVLLPEGAGAEEFLATAASVDNALSFFDLTVGGETRAAVLLGSMAWGVTEANVERWVAHLHLGRTIGVVVQQVSRCALRLSDLLQSGATASASRLFHALAELSEEALAACYLHASEGGRRMLAHYRDEIRPIGVCVDGSDLVALGYQPQQAFARILARALDDRLEGRAVGRVAELANLREIARDALGEPGEHTSAG